MPHLFEKQGVDPEYSFNLSAHVYLIKYFLENVYCSYIAWFLIYQEGLISKNIKILDIAAGPGTVAYGLALLLQSSSGFFSMPQMHTSYYSLEKQHLLQYRGLQFWRQYTDKRTPTSGIEFAKFAKENLPKQKYMNPLKQQYLQQKFASDYAIDDYVILARR